MIEEIKKLLTRLQLDPRFRYLCVGGINTVFGYVASLFLYWSLAPVWHIVGIAVLGNIVCITFSFVTYKLFVFKTKGRWLQEYAKCYVVYFGSSVLGIVGIWIMIDMLHIPFWIAQAALIGVTVVFSYIGHSCYSFRRKKTDS